MTLFQLGRVVYAFSMFEPYQSFLVAGWHVPDTANNPFKCVLLSERLCDEFYRIRMETVLLKSNVPSEVQRSMMDGGMLVEDLSIDPLLRVGSTSRVGQDKLPIETREAIQESCVGWAVQLDLLKF
ncbi:hypothetical protein LINPERHAP1_LOCUS7218 [Linum perenne]